MDSCIFCKLIKGEIPSYTINENTSCVAFLDINPNTPGATVVATKNHYDSDITTLDPTVMADITLFVQETCQKIQERLKVKRVGVAVEGMGVNHFHVKLYPFHGLGDQLEALDTTHERVFYTSYPGFMTTQLGNQADFEELKKIKELFD